MNYPVFQVDPSMRISDPIESIENTGYLRKFWILHPKLGKSLVKLEEETAPAWSEKASYEIAKILNLTAASYEIGVLVGWEQYPTNPKVVLSPNFKQPNMRYFQGAELLAQTSPDYSYSVREVFRALEQNKVRLPTDYQPPDGISDGADLFVGYLLLDSLIANNDRHEGNWEIGLDNAGVISLAPVFDNGASFGTTFGSLVYENYTVEKYMKTDVSMFGQLQAETFNRAARLRPEAAKIWLSQLAKIEQQQLETILAAIPFERITDEAKVFALDLLAYNRIQLLNFSKKLNTSKQNKE